MNIVFFSDCMPGSNPEAIFLKSQKIPILRPSFVERYSHVAGHKLSSIDMAVTNNLRCMGGNYGTFNANTQHGNFFLGDSSLENRMDLYTVASASEKEMMVKNGTPEDIVVVTGCARTDRLFRHTQSPDLEAIKTLQGTYGVENGQKVFLYAPTYDRGNLGFGSKGFFACSTSEAQEIEIATRIIEAVRTIGGKLIIRVHKYYKKKWKNLAPDYLVNVFEKAGIDITSNETHPDSIPIIIGADVLITDFSSIVADFLPMKKPVVFIEPNPDWKYTDKWHAPKKCREGIGNIIHVPADVEKALLAAETLYTKLHSSNCDMLVQKYIPLFDGKATKRNLEEILDGHENKRTLG